MIIFSDFDTVLSQVYIVLTWQAWKQGAIRTMIQSKYNEQHTSVGNKCMITCIAWYMDLCPYTHLNRPPPPSDAPTARSSLLPLPAKLAETPMWREALRHRDLNPGLLHDGRTYGPLYFSGCGELVSCKILL